MSTRLKICLMSSSVSWRQSLNQLCEWLYYNLDCATRPFHHNYYKIMLVADILQPLFSFLPPFNSCLTHLGLFLLVRFLPAAFFQFAHYVLRVLFQSWLSSSIVQNISYSIINRNGWLSHSCTVEEIGGLTQNCGKRRTSSPFVSYWSNRFFT